MPNSRTRRSRAPSPESRTSPESQTSPASDIFGKVAKSVLEYSIQHYLTRPSSSSRKGSPPDKSPDMPSKNSSSRDEGSRAFGSSSRRNDPTHELISHLIRGAAALAARHLLRSRSKKKEKEKSSAKAKAPRRDEFVGAPVPERRRHRHRHRHRYTDPGPQPELVGALDSLSAELGRTTTQIRQLAGQRRPHRHRNGRCDVYEGLVRCASRLEGETVRVRAGVNNIRNLGFTSGPTWREGENYGTRSGSYLRTRDVDGVNEGRKEGGKRAGSYARTREVPDGAKPRGRERKVRISGDENRGRKRTTSR